MKAMVTATPPPKTDLPLPSRTRRGGRRAAGGRQRIAFALMLVLFAAAGAAAVWSFVRPSTDPWVGVGLIEDFPPGTVTSFRAFIDTDGREGFHIVRLDDGELLALRDRDTHFGEPIPYRPEFVWDGRPGWFRGVHAEIYDMAGRRVFGPGWGDLGRLAVEVRKRRGVRQSAGETRRGGVSSRHGATSSRPAAALPVPRGATSKVAREGVSGLSESREAGLKSKWRRSWTT